MPSIRVAVFLSVWATLLTARAQDFLSSPETKSPPILITGDLAVLESGEPRKDLNCKVAPDKAILGWDLKFHASYEVELPLREIEGSGNTLSIVFRVVAKGSERGPVYFSQKILVPAVAATAGDVSLYGTFNVGEGSYHVDWLMRDSIGRFCSAYWDLEAALSKEEKQIPVALPALAIERSEGERFQAQQLVERGHQECPLHVKILMNFEPQQPGAAALDPQDLVVPVSILRGLSRQGLIEKISLVAFNLQERKILYQQNSSDQIDFPSMGKALNRLHMGTVDVGQLGKKNGDAEFLSSLVKSQASADDDADGLIFISPKLLTGSDIPEKDLKQIGELHYPVFYMNYTHAPEAILCRDAIGRIVKFFKGREYTIDAPRDLWDAVSETVARIAKAKQGKSTTRAVPLP